MQDRLKQPTDARETLHTWIWRHTRFGLHVNTFTSEQKSVGESLRLLRGIKSPLVLLAKAGCGQGKVLKGKEDKKRNTA